jgi:hypothetical protein
MYKISELEAWARLWNVAFASDRQGADLRNIFSLSILLGTRGENPVFL